MKTQFEKIIEKDRKYYNTIRVVNLVLSGLAFLMGLIALIIALVK
jgi:hypothetical protein